MYKYIIFDVDGTMIDTEEAVTYGYQSVIFKEFGRYFSDEELLAGSGVPTPQTLAKYGFTDIEKAQKDFYVYLIEGYARSKPFEGILEILDEIKAGNISMGIATSRSNYEVENDSTLQKFINKFDCTVCSDDTVLHKPNPDPLLEAMKRMNADPSETLYIGDTINDRKCAKGAGVKFALALWGSNDAHNIDADIILKKPSDILEIINP